MRRAWINKNSYLRFVIRALDFHGRYCHECLGDESPFCRITLHHVLSQKDYPHWKKEIMNVIPLCKCCHDKKHNR